MIKKTKKKNLMNKNINKHKEYNMYEAIEILKQNQSKNFIESVDIAINLSINPKKSEQSVRGSTVLPHGIGRKIKVAVFAQGENIQKAKKYGADLAGGNEIIEHFKNKKNNFDIVLATPEIMPMIGKLGPILGPKGLMPNPKTGTITNNLKEAIFNAKKGKIKYKNDKNGIIHTTIGKINFSNEYLYNNLNQLIVELNKIKPMHSKGNFIKKIVISTTMGIGLKITNYKLQEKL
ncbi:50S ribosomal protein L1 [Buchnera aphidicola]|uniref:50S ribosomal protein L1 n=1 Tax=Buchnera aphidicola TaxID=9 RepID=UPI0034646245